MGRPRIAETSPYRMDLLSMERLEQIEGVYLSALRSSDFTNSEMSLTRRYLSAVQSELKARYNNPTSVDSLADLWESTQRERAVA